MAERRLTDVDVLIVGAGPTGLMAANLLAVAGVSALVIERDEDLNDLPRAVSVDDESMRALQAAKLLEAAQKIIVEGTGTRYYGRRGQLLVHARGPEPPPLGHAIKNPIDQPEFDRMLLDGLRAHSDVEVRFRRRLQGLDERDDHVVATINGDEVRAKYVLGCDGARSTVRSLLGIGMNGMSFDESWIVIDAVRDPHTESYAMHYGDPRRPHVIVPGREGRCRYEFLLLPGEDPRASTEWEFVRRLVAPYRTDFDRDDVVRCVVYRFHALIATEWRDGRAFILGDAAHMMPPFAGQGLNSGIRDAFNLSWKIAMAVKGLAGDALLDTYELERKPHAHAMVELSKRLGKVVMTTNKRAAVLRDVVLGTAARTPGVRRYGREMRFKPAPLFTGGFVITLPAELNGGNGRRRHTRRKTTAGHMLPQPSVMTQSRDQFRLDSVLGDEFALLLVAEDAPLPKLSHAVWETLSPKVVRVVRRDSPLPQNGGIETVGDANGLLADLIGARRGQAVLVRPDRFIVGGFKAADEDACAEQLSGLLDARASEEIAV